MDIVSLWDECFGELIGLAGLSDEQIERRQAAIPFDQGRARAESPQRLAIKRPDRLSHGTAVVVDQDDPLAHRIGLMAGQVNFADGLGGQGARYLLASKPRFWPLT